MYLHLGGATVVTTKSIIGIFDIDYCSVGKRTRMYLAKAQSDGCVINVSDDLPKSFIVCEENGKQSVYISAISAPTLKKRWGFIDDISNIE
ncbi:MAG: DUF370 domain-containing protein [Oscillospiraceae bacterium]